VVPGGTSAEGLHWLHRVIAGILGMLLLATIWLGFEERRPSWLLWALVGGGVLYITQALVGAANIWTETAAGVVVLHLSLAALLWCLMVAVTAVAWYRPGALAVEEQGRIAGRTTKASEWAR
jgi:heme A synthase